MFWCCCGGTPAIPPHWYYGGRYAFYDSGTDTWKIESLAANSYPGSLISPCYRLLTPPYTIFTDHWPFNIVIFPILANPGQTISSATFHLRMWNSYSLHGPYYGTFRARQVVSTAAEVNPNTVAEWNAVKAWVTDPPVSFDIDIVSSGTGYDCAEFDVTARVQTMVNQPGFHRGGCFAAIVEAIGPDTTDGPFDPLQVVGNGSQASGVWSPSWPPPSATPHPSPGSFSHQNYLVIT